MYKSLDELRDTVSECRKCGLCETRKNTVFGEGAPDARVFFVGEGPGATEDETGRPFVGRAGQLLDKMLASIDLSRESVYIANIVKCRPPGNADPTPEWAETCLPYLREQVKLVKPKVIVCLGRIAMSHILKETRGITRVHGEITERNGYYIMPMFHPSALLRNQSWKKDAWEDLKKLRDLLQEKTIL